MGCEGVTDIAIKCILNNSQKLKYLNITYTGVTIDIIREAVSLIAEIARITLF